MGDSKIVMKAVLGKSYLVDSRLAKVITQATMEEK
jgi:hypothetical protein